MKKLKGIESGQIIPTYSCGDVLVLNIHSKSSVDIMFLDYPCELKVRSGSLRTGMVKNPMRPTIYKVGFFGIGPYKLEKTYRTWSNMLQRVYEPPTEGHARQYAGTSVHTHWHNFQNFAAWYETQINRFGLVDFEWHLDKDLLIPGNRIYGPDTCCIVPLAVNMLFTDHAFARGNLPMGVSKSGNNYRAKVSQNGKIKWLGSYPTIRLAQLSYWKAKFEAIQMTSVMYWNYLPEPIAMRFIAFGWEDAFAYYGDDARLWEDER
jgi:hypothetical protein